MHGVPASALLTLIVISGFPLGLCAQSTNASLTGRITDPSKATIANAKIRNEFRKFTAFMTSGHA